MRTLITEARRVAGYHGPVHGYWDMIFDAEAILFGGRSLLSRPIVEAMLIEAVGTAEDRQTESPRVTAER